VQSTIALIKSHQMEIIVKTETKERLTYELKVSIEKENFERAAEIRKKLEALSDKE
jgi:protein-arginine kinase activator protein McsA